MYNYENPRYRAKVWENIKYAAIATILLWLLAVVTGYGQEPTYTMADMRMGIDSTTGGMVYTDVIQVENATSDQLYSRAKSFLLKAFTNESPVVQLDDKEMGIVGGRGKLSMNLTTGQAMLTGQLSMYYEMAVEIRVKDGRYRYEFSNIEVVNRGQRIQVDNELRKRPKTAQKMMSKAYTQREYDQYMSDKNPVNIVIRQLKQAMNPVGDKNNF